MARMSRAERKAEMKARIDKQNFAAAAIPLGTSYEDWLFGTVVLEEFAAEYTDEEGWEHYWVTHSGSRHCWSSASVVAAFKRA